MTVIGETMKIRMLLLLRFREILIIAFLGIMTVVMAVWVVTKFNKITAATQTLWGSALFY
jgi:hypothetical protein